MKSKFWTIRVAIWSSGFEESDTTGNFPLGVDVGALSALQFIGNCSVAYVILTHQSDPPLLIFCHGMLQSEGACIVHLLQNPQDKNRCFGNRDNKKMRLCPKVNPHDSIRVLMCGLRTGIPSGLAPGAQSFQTGSPSSGGFHPFRSGWIGRESFLPTFIWFWKADS